MADPGDPEKRMATHSSSYLENSKDRGVWRAIVHGVAESNMTNFCFHFHGNFLLIAIIIKSMMAYY